MGDIGIVFAPILDGFASLIGFLAESKAAVVILATVMGGLAIASITNAIASMFATPGIGWAIGAAGTLMLIASLTKAKSAAKADDMFSGYGDNTLVTKNKGAIMLNNNDSIVAGTNLLGGGGGEKIDYDAMASAMSKAQVNVSTQYDSFSANSTTAGGGSYQSTARYESKFA